MSYKLAECLAITNPSCDHYSHDELHTRTCVHSLKHTCTQVSMHANTQNKVADAVAEIKTTRIESHF